MRKLFFGSLFAVCLGCDDKVSMDQVKGLEATVARLEARIVALEAENATQAATLTNAQPILAAASALLDFMYLDVDNNIVIENADLNIRSGSGATNGPPNGKGNLCLGYCETEQTIGSCVGGVLAGANCVDDASCSSGGVCDKLSGVVKTGSHNLIIGNGISYSSYGCIGVGSDHVLGGPGSVALGGDNIVTGRGAVALGAGNTASGNESTVLGGPHNVVESTTGVIYGGSYQTASGAVTLLP